LFRGPGVVAGGELSSPVESVDLVPTVLEVLGLPPMERLSGRSLAEALHGGREPEPRPLYAESLMASLLYGWGRLVSVREGPWKLIEAPKPELYNLTEDPKETDNRIRRNAAAAERLRARLAELAPGGLDAGTTSSSEIDPELMEKLGALGYVGGRRAGTGGDAKLDPKDQLEEFRVLSENMRAGLQHLQKKEYADAVERFRAILETGNDSFQALYHMGRAQYGLGRYREAVSAFEGALALDPSYGPSYVDLAEAYLALERPLDAVAALKRGQQALPTSARLFEREGEIWVGLERPREAAQAFEQVVERLPGDALSQVRLGEQYRDLDEIDLALSHLREATRLDPDEPSYWNSLGMVLGGNGHMEEAADAFQRALQAGPANAEYAFNLGLALARLGRKDEARSSFENALGSDPSFEPARRELSRLDAER
jgi:tetratricopeptide (TPR) repeat protein